MKRRRGEHELLGQVLKRMFGNRIRRGVSKLMKLQATWKDVVEEEVACCSRITSFRRGIVYIEVDSPALMYELSQFRKKEILEGIRNRTRLNDVEDLKFKTV